MQNIQVRLCFPNHKLDFHHLYIYIYDGNSITLMGEINENINTCVMCVRQHRKQQMLHELY